MLDIVIVNWNSGRLIEECLSSLPSVGTQGLASITVVDNGSTDSSPERIAQFDQVRLVKTGANQGFGRACNIGTAFGNADFILFLNPDATLPDGVLGRLTVHLETRSPCEGIFGVRLIGEDGKTQRSCRRFPRAGRLIAESIGLDRIFAQLSVSMSDWDHLETAEVDQIIGAFFLIPRDLFSALHGFDERFFVYYEEVDLSYRAKLSGYKSIYLADITAHHTGGGVSSQVKAARLFYSLRSRILYARKHLSTPGAVGVSVMTLGPEFLSRLMLLALRRRWGEVGNLCHGYAALWRWFILARGGLRPSVHDRAPLE